MVVGDSATAGVETEIGPAAGVDAAFLLNHLHHGP